MAKKRLFVAGFFITLLMLVTILFSNFLMSNLREDAVIDRMATMLQSYEEMQTLLIMADFFGEESTCIALESLLMGMNEDLWELGIKIDQYRQVTEEFTRSPFYFEQKKLFNQRAILYFSMLKQMHEMCNVNQLLMTFFYIKSEDCPNCDAQSFVLTDIRMDLERINRSDELALFSFDVDLNLPTVNLLLKHYNITEFPCVLVEDDVFCGLRNKNEVRSIICDRDGNTICY